MPQQLDISEEGQSNVSMVASSASTDSICQNSPVLKERNYMGLSDCSSVESSVTTSPSEKDATLNLKATELRLGLPGSQSPTRDREMCMLSPSKLDEKPLFPLAPLQKIVVPGNKRGFSDVMDGLSEENTPVFTDCKWMFPAAGLESETAQSVPQGKLSTIPGLNVVSSRPSPNSTIKSVSIKDQTGATSAHLKEITPSKIPQEVMSSANNNGRAPPAKAQVVGWPPIRSFRKNTLTTTLKDNEEVEGKHGSGALFVKVSMDGAPYLRKVDLNLYSTYLELSSALEKMFSCFTIGQYGSHAAPGRDMLSESKLRDILHRSEYVLTYEDKDGDWMLVGDVPWQMFIDSCKRLHIMKSSDAIGLAPRATEKFRKQN